MSLLALWALAEEHARAALAAAGSLRGGMLLAEAALPKVALGTMVLAKSSLFAVAVHPDIIRLLILQSYWPRRRPVFDARRKAEIEAYPRSLRPPAPKPGLVGASGSLRRFQAENARPSTRRVQPWWSVHARRPALRGHRGIEPARADAGRRSSDTRTPTRGLDTARK